MYIFPRCCPTSTTSAFLLMPTHNTIVITCCYIVSHLTIFSDIMIYSKSSTVVKVTWFLPWPDSPTILACSYGSAEGWPSSCWGTGSTCWCSRTTRPIETLPSDNSSHPNSPRDNSSHSHFAPWTTHPMDNSPQDISMGRIVRELLLQSPTNLF